jgi:hypothetical protein
MSSETLPAFGPGPSDSPLGPNARRSLEWTPEFSGASGPTRGFEASSGLNKTRSGRTLDQIQAGPLPSRETAGVLTWPAQ